MHTLGSVLLYLTARIHVVCKRTSANESISVIDNGSVLIPKMLGTLPASLTSQTGADPDTSSRQRFESCLQQLLNTTCAQTPIAAMYSRTCHGQCGSSIAMMFALLAMWGAVSRLMLDIQRPPNGANGKYRVPGNKHIFDMHFVLAPCCFRLHKHLPCKMYIQLPTTTSGVAANWY
jgi:hypothetical protein